MGIRRSKLVRAALVSLAVALCPLGETRADDRQSLEELRNTVVNLLQALVDQGVITREKAEQMVKAAQDKAAADAAALAKTEEGAVRVPYVPQIVQDQIAKQVESQVKPEVVADVVKEAKLEKWGVPGALADWLTRTRLYGNVTLREEDILFPAGNVQGFYLNYYAINQAGGQAAAGANAFENVSVDRPRFRGRVRLGVESDITSSITAGLRLATGNTSDLVSETQTLDGTAPYAFGVDELYVRFDARNEDFTWLTAVGGRFENPYLTPTNLIFHRDLTFTGAALTARLGLGDGGAQQSHLYLVLGGHPIQEIALSSHDKYLAGAELGAYFRWDGGQSLRFNAAYYDYFNVTGRLNPSGEPGLYNYTAPQFLRQGNTYFDISNTGNPGVNLYALASKFRLVNVNATFIAPIGPFSFALSADAVRNVGYNTAEVTASFGQYQAPRINGYQAEASFGTPSLTGGFGSWRGALGYRYLQRDAVIDAYTDSDFHFGGTDATGYYLVGEMGLAHNLWMRLRYMSSNAIDGPQLSIDTVQLDLNTQF